MISHTRSFRLSVRYWGRKCKVGRHVQSIDKDESSKLHFRKGNRWHENKVGRDGLSKLTFESKEDYHIETNWKTYKETA